MGKKEKPGLWLMLPVKVAEYRIKKVASPVAKTRTGLRKDQSSKTLELRKVFELVCAHYSFTTGDVLAKTRKADIVYVRWAFCYWCSQNFDLITSYNSGGKEVDLKLIASLSGYADHSGVVHAIRTFFTGLEINDRVPDKLITTHRTMREDYEQLLNILHDYCN